MAMRELKVLSGVRLELPTPMPPTPGIGMMEGKLPSLEDELPGEGRMMELLSSLLDELLLVGKGRLGEPLSLPDDEW